MSNAGAPAGSKPFVLTGNIALDAMILRGLALLAGIFATMIVTWLNAHGFQTAAFTIAGHTFSVAEMLTAGILSALVALAAFVWSYISTKINIARVAMAGAQLVQSGQALLDEAGQLKPITQKTAPDIVRNFAPPTAPKTN